MALYLSRPLRAEEDLPNYDVEISQLLNAREWCFRLQTFIDPQKNVFFELK